MGEQISAHIEYDEPFSPDNVKQLFMAVSEAVSENWRELRDEWSSPKPEYLVNVDAWLAQCFSETGFPLMLRSGQEGQSYVHYFHFSFSPLSAWVCSLSVTQRGDKRISAGFILSKSVIFEEKGEREQERIEKTWNDIREQRGESSLGKKGPDVGHPDYAPWWEKWNMLAEQDEEIWPQNKKCLQRMIEALALLFPVRRMKIDESLRGG